jgi:hypothetical protein
LSIGKIPSRAATVALAGERRASWSSDMQPYETLTVQQLFDYIRKNTSVTDDYALNEQALVLLSEATNSILELKNALFNRRPMMEKAEVLKQEASCLKVILNLRLRTEEVKYLQEIDRQCFLKRQKPADMDDS